MNVNIVGNDDIKSLEKAISKNLNVIVVKKFIKKNQCSFIIDLCHKYSKTKIQKGIYYSIDVLPKKVKTQRIFRTFIFKKFLDNNIGKKLIYIQEDIIKSKIPKNYHRRFQVIHYPDGGGFFDWHKHQRYPSNYGIILNLSKYDKLNNGLTEFKYGKKIIKLTDNNIDAGDLILFKYDLTHRVSEVRPDKDLKFDKKGRWTLILPILQNKELIYNHGNKK